MGLENKDEHRKRLVRESRRRIRARRMELGLCVECASPNDRKDRQTCSKCSKKAISVVNKRNERLRNEG